MSMQFLKKNFGAVLKWDWIRNSNAKTKAKKIDGGAEILSFEFSRQKAFFILTLHSKIEMTTQSLVNLQNFFTKKQTKTF